MLTYMCVFAMMLYICMWLFTIQYIRYNTLYNTLYGIDITIVHV